MKKKKKKQRVKIKIPLSAYRLIYIPTYQKDNYI